MLRDLSKTLIVRGLLAIGLGIVAIVWPSITVWGFVIVFAVFAFTDAVFQSARAFSSASAGPVAGHLLLALLDIAAGVVALVWPEITAYALVIWVGAWAIATGVVEVAIAFLQGETAGERTAWAIAGGLSIVFGGVVFAHPRAGALALALVFGFFALSLGISTVWLGIDARKTDNRMLSAVQGRSAA